MAILVYGMNQSLDGYVDHESAVPSRQLFRHFVDHVASLSGIIYGRRIYEVMRYWDDEQPSWSDDERDFAVAWRGQRKWVASRSLTSAGPNVTLVHDDIAGVVQRLKQELPGTIEVAGPELAATMTEHGLIDEYRMYMHPVVLGSGKPYFAGARPRLRFKSSERIDDDVIRLTYTLS